MRIMSKLALAALLLCPVLALAAVPATVAFTARIADGGAPVTGTHSFTFTLYDADTAGNNVWTETMDLAVSDGVVATALGATTALPAFTGSALFLEVAMDGAAPFSPRLAIHSVPYALHAAEADHATSADSATNATNATNASAAPWTGITGKPTGLTCTGSDTDSVTISAGGAGSAAVYCSSGVATAANVPPTAGLRLSGVEAYYFGASPTCGGIICLLGWRNACRAYGYNEGTSNITLTVNCRCCSIQ